MEYTLKDWVKDLRSGEFEQTIKSLRRKEYGKIKHCCAGVLAERLGHTFKTHDNRIHMSDVIHNEETYKALKNWVKIQSNGRLDLGFYMGLNDSGVSFREIADLIEKGYKDIV